MAWKKACELTEVASAILPLLQGHLNSENEQLKKFYLEILKWSCRHLERFIDPEVSVNALSKAISMGIGDPRKYNWNHQIREMKDVGRKIFHWEHVYPVSSMVSDLLKLDSQTTSSVTNIIIKADIAWILKTEDKLLTKHGFKSKRPTNPWDAYSKSGIEIADR